MKINSFAKLSALVALFLLFLVGCSNRKFTQLYEGPEQPQGNIANIILDLPDSSLCDVTIINTSDDEAVKLLERTFRTVNILTEPLKILPGKYNIKVEMGSYYQISGMSSGGSYLINSKPRARATCSVDFDIEAGKTFYVKAKKQVLKEVTWEELNLALEKGLIVEGFVDNIEKRPNYIRGGTSMDIKYKYKNIIVTTEVRDKATMELIAYSSFNSKGEMISEDKQSLFREWDKEKYEEIAHEIDKNTIIFNPIRVNIIDVKKIDSNGNYVNYSGWIDGNYYITDPGYYRVSFSINLDYSTDKLSGSLNGNEVKQLSFEAKEGQTYLIKRWVRKIGDVVIEWGGGIEINESGVVIAGKTQGQYLFENKHGKIDDLDKPETIESLFKELGSKSYQMRWYAAKMLANTNNAEIVDSLIEILGNRHSNTNLVENAAKALGLISDERAVEPLIDVLTYYENDDSYSANQVKAEVAYALGKIGDPRAVEAISRSFQITTASYRFHSYIKALGNIGGSLAIETLVSAHRNPLKSYKKDIVKALGQIGETDSTATKALIGFLNDYDRETRFNSVRCLGRLRSNKAIEPLISRLRYDDLEIRMAALYSLRNITGESFSHNYREWQNWWETNKSVLK